MQKFLLSEITTQDGLVHQGIFFKPTKPGKKAILYVHGLISNFYNNVHMLNSIAQACEKHAIAFASFNNRGHDMVVGAKKNGMYTTIGSGNERFEECIFDIDAGIRFLIDAGYHEIILIGKSTGANKVSYYATAKQHSHLTGIILIAPLSDRLNPVVHLRWYELAYLRLLVLIGKDNTLIFGRNFFPATASRLLSLLTPNSIEDIFNYGDNIRTLSRFSTINSPILIILAGNDQYADRSMKKVKITYDRHTKSKLYKSIIIPGANHGFDGKEKVVVDHIISWVKEL